MTISEFISKLRKTDLTYIRPNHKIATLIGVSKEQKEKQIIKKQIYFISNLKHLKSISGKVDKRNLKTNRSCTEMCVSLLEDICKIRKAAQLDKQTLIEYDEFLDYEENQSKDLEQFLNKNLDRYANYYDFTKKHFENLVRDNEEEIGEAYLALIEDTKDKAETIRLLRPTLEAVGIKIEM